MRTRMEDEEWPVLSSKRGPNHEEGWKKLKKSTRPGLPRARLGHAGPGHEPAAKKRKGILPLKWFAGSISLKAVDTSYRPCSTLVRDALLPAP